MIGSSKLLPSPATAEHTLQGIPTHATVASTNFDNKSLFFAFVVVSFRDFLLLEGYLDIIFHTTFPIKPDNHIELASSSASSPRDNIG